MVQPPTGKRGYYRVQEIPAKERKGIVRELIRELEECKDQYEKRKLRSRLRRFGHTGGMQRKKK